MTDREKCIVMAYTGVCMLAGKKIDIFYKYLAELFGRPVYTHEMVNLDIKETAKQDFIKLCKTDDAGWIPCSERLPEDKRCVLITERFDPSEFDSDNWYVDIAYMRNGKWEYRDDMSTAIPPKPIAWMHFPEPFCPNCGSKMEDKE